MKKIIHNLRKQPEAVRTRVLHILTVSASVILLLLWVYSLGTNLTNAETQAKAKKDLEPFSVLKDNLVGGYKSLTPTTESIEVDQSGGYEEIDMSVLE
jgi:hypothetical protein